jgi:predicted enzyme related to lactoylglutathione lyase
MADANPDRLRFECCNPILRVENMQAALQFYVGMLDFENAPWGNEDFTCVTNGRVGIYLCRGDQGRGRAWVWVGVEDAAKLHDTLKARGVKIKLPPTNFSWALEMQIEDFDGNVLRFGSDPLGEQSR